MSRSFLAILAGVLLIFVQAHPALARSEAFTSQIVGKLESGIRECQALPTVYRFDCYRQNYRAVGRDLKRPDYRPAQSALRRVEKTLNTIVRKNTDKTKPQISQNGRKYKAITPQAVKPAAAAFDQARAEATTVLLRTKGDMKPHFERIAAVVGSNKVILRASLGLLLGAA